MHLFQFFCPIIRLLMFYLGALCIFFTIVFFTLTFFLMFFIYKVNYSLNITIMKLKQFQILPKLNVSSGKKLLILLLKSSLFYQFKLELSLLVMILIIIIKLIMIPVMLFMMMTMMMVTMMMVALMALLFQIFHFLIW